MLDLTVDGMWYFTADDMWPKGVCPEQQREESSHGVQTLVVVDDSPETDAVGWWKRITKDSSKMIDDVKQQI